jgi:hypothetical protein
MNNIKQVIEEIEDYLIPFLSLDTYEKSLYYHLFRHTRLIGKQETIFVISSAPKTVGLTDFSARDRIRKLNEKGCIKIEEVTRDGLRVSVLLPSEINGCIVIPDVVDNVVNIELIDFYNDPKYRLSILNRENGECFYCFRKITKENYVLDHMISQVNNGNNSYKNIVASCHECNSLKTGKNGDDFVRLLYRKQILSSKELESRLLAIQKLINGELRPDIN